MLSCPHPQFPKKSDSHHRSFLNIFIISAIAITLIAAASAWASTGTAGEIFNIAVQNVTPTSVDIVWDTLHLSTSQVVLTRDTGYQGERRITAADSSLVNHHRVRVNHLMPYDPAEGLGTYYFYVVSAD